MTTATRRGGPGLERAHPVAAFFVLSCLLSWACWGIAAVVGGDIARLLDLAAPFGPAGAALAVTALVRAGDEHDRAGQVTVQRPLWWVVALLVLAAVALREQWREAFDPGPQVVVLVGLGLLTALPPLLCALWWRLDRGRNDAVSRRSAWPWLLVALLLWPVVGVLGVLVTGGPGELDGGSAWPASATGLALVLVSTAVYGGPLGEELGWRGFALRRLQESRSPLVASVVIGLVWGAWHLPLHLRGDYASMGGLAGGFALRLVSQVAVAVVFTWLFNRSRGSLLAVVVLHASLNNTVGFWLPESLGFQVGVGLLATTVVLVDRMWEGPDGPTDDLGGGPASVTAAPPAVTRAPSTRDRPARR